MDALLSTLIACLCIEMGDRSQLLTLALAIRYRRDGAVIAGLFAAAFANAALSAAAGWYVSTLIVGNARSLFLALALLFAGVGLLWPVKPPDPLAGWRIGPFLTTALGIFILGFGDGSQFLIAGIAARTADPVMAALGGGIGVFIACLPVVLLRESFFTALPLRIVRRAGAILFLLIGAIMALSAVALL